MTQPPHPRIVRQPPTGSGTYVHGTPRWLQYLVRAGFLLFAGGLVVLSNLEWSTMPAPAKALAAVLVPAFTVLAFWQRPWRTTVRFVADPTGLYFPGRSRQVLMLMRAPEARWLHVPWSAIGSVRVAHYDDCDRGLCLALDVTIAPEYHDDFFRHVGAPWEQGTPPRGVLRLAYDDRPPHPRSAAARVESIRRMAAVATR